MSGLRSVSLLSNEYMMILKEILYVTDYVCFWGGVSLRWLCVFLRRCVVKKQGRVGQYQTSGLFDGGILYMYRVGQKNLTR